MQQESAALWLVSPACMRYCPPNDDPPDRRSTVLADSAVPFLESSHDPSQERISCGADEGETLDRPVLCASVKAWR